MNQHFENREAAERHLTEGGWNRTTANPRKFVSNDGSTQAVILDAPEVPGDWVLVSAWPVPRCANPS